MRRLLLWGAAGVLALGWVAFHAKNFVEADASVALYIGEGCKISKLRIGGDDLVPFSSKLFYRESGRVEVSLTANGIAHSEMVDIHRGDNYISLYCDPPTIAISQ